MNRDGLFTLIMMALVVLWTVLPVSAGAANSSVKREVTVRSSRELDPRTAAIVASAGTRTLVCIAEARGAIWEKDASRAREDLREAENLLSLIRSTMPTATVKDRIWVARRHLEYEDAQQVLPDLVPIDQELVLLEGFVPTGEARTHLGLARRFLESGDRQAGLDELKAVDAAVAYEEMDLPISETEAQVSRALGELAIGETEKADLALQAAEEDVQVIVATARRPLTKGYPAADTQANQQTRDK